MQPFDLDAAVNDKAGQPYQFTWGGQPFEIPPVLSMDIETQLDLMERIERLDQADAKQLFEVIKLVIGESTLEQMRAARPISAVALMTVIQEWMAHQGPDLGKSSASSPSSANGARPSKPTSRSGRAHRTS